jgi:hypothetical protein
MGPTSPHRLARCPPVPRSLGQQFFGQRALLQVAGSHAGQPCIRPHRSGDRPRPPRPTADLVVLQAHCAFCRFTTALHCPAGARRLDHLHPGGGLWGKDDTGRQRAGRPHTAPDPQPAAPRREPRGGPRQPAPVIPAGAFGPRTCTVPRPAIRWQRRQDGLHLALLPAEPAICLARDREHGRAFVGFPPPPPILALDTVAGHPRGRDTRLAGPLQPGAGQGGLRGQQTCLRHPCPGAALTSLRPLLGAETVHGRARQGHGHWRRRATPRSGSAPRGPPSHSIAEPHPPPGAPL